MDTFQDPLGEFAVLKDLLYSAAWPAAIDPVMICDVTSDQDKQDRAEGILDLIIDVSLRDLNFLDFGCGEGHVVSNAMAQTPKKVMGYDVVKYDRWATWPENPNMQFTIDWAEVEKNAPYDVILVFDVIDHMQGTDQDVVGELRKIKSLLTPEGKVFVRCHPWCSRHGTHICHQLNKAFVHLVFHDHEIEHLGLTQFPTRRIIHPIMTYDAMFKEVGFHVPHKPQVLRGPVEPFFFETPLVAQRIKSRYLTSYDDNLRLGKKFPTQLDQQFADYLLLA